MGGRLSSGTYYLSIDKIVQSVLLFGSIFLINFGYYKKILYLNPAHLIMILLCVYSGFKICMHRFIKLKYTKHMTVVAVFQIFGLVLHGFSAYDFLVVMTVLLVMLALLNDVFNVELFWSIVEIWAIIATLMVMIQSIAYYFAGVAIDFFPIALVDELRLAEDQKLHIAIIQNGIYRPAAFFAEPSHFTHFVSPLLIQYMLTEDLRQKKFKLLIFVSVGVVLTTSGIGIATVVGIWVLYGLQLLYSKKKRYLLYGLGLLTILSMCFIILLNYNATFQESILRIFTGSSTSISALQGRTAGIEGLFNTLDEGEFWFGTGEISNRIDNRFIGGIFQLIYQNGIFSAILYILVFLYAAIKLNKGKRWNALYIILISFFAGIHSYPSLIYNAFAIYSGFLPSYTDKKY